MGEIQTRVTRRGFLQGTALAAASAAVPARPAPAVAAGQVGQWSPIHPWPCVGIHTHLLPNGRVLTWADDAQPFPRRSPGSSKAFVVNIPNGGAPLGTWTEIDNQHTNLFCSGHAYLPDGRLLVVGGDLGYDYGGSADVTIFSTKPSYAWQRQDGSPMAGGRWYASALTLASGEVLVLGGGEDRPAPIAICCRRCGGPVRAAGGT